MNNKVSGIFSCGLFGISEDFAEKRLSLDERFEIERESIFLVRAIGDSMKPLIFQKDILIIDKSIEAKSGHIITFHFNGNPLCKKLIKNGQGFLLRSLNSKYDDITITKDDTVEIFGVVVGISRELI